MSKYCYWCGKEINDSNDHFEHIIPQSLGGKLSVNGILHKDCGNSLGERIDSLFAQKFSFITNIISIKRDRGNNSCSIVTIELDENKTNAKVFDKNIEISKPFFDPQRRIVYCTENQKKFLKKKKELSDYVFLSKFDFDGDFGNSDFSNIISCSNEDKLALVKIAVEFAVFCGVSPKQLDRALGKECFKDTIIIPYYPLTNFEMLFEKNRFLFEPEFVHLEDNTDIPFFSIPTHQLHLFSFGSKLYCFISLYDFYEFYVLLSDKYEGSYCSFWYLMSACDEKPYISTYYLGNESSKNIAICQSHWGNGVDVLKKIDNCKMSPDWDGKISYSFNPVYKFSSIKNHCPLISTSNEVEQHFLSVLDKMLHVARLRNTFKDNQNKLKTYLNKYVQSYLDKYGYQILDDTCSLERDPSILNYLKRNGDNEYFDLDLYKSHIYDKGILKSIPELILSEGLICEEKSLKYRKQKMFQILDLQFNSKAKSKEAKLVKLVATYPSQF